MTFALGTDSNGRQTFLLPLSNYEYSGLLTSAGGEQTLTLPANPSTTSGLWAVIFSIEPGSSVWVAVNNTAVVPSSSIATTKSKLNPTGFTKLNSGDVLHLITSDTSVMVGITLYAL